MPGRCQGDREKKFFDMMLLWDGIGWNGSRRMWTARFGCVERLLLRTAGNEDGWIGMKDHTSDWILVLKIPA